MNNTQFRSLLLNNANSGSGASNQNRNVAATPSQRPSATPALGSRARSSIPMTPRSVAGYSAANDFARQLAEHKRELSGEPPTKKFRSSAAPKGTKLAQGYHDRTSLRRADEEGGQAHDDKEKRLTALEEMLKLQQIDLGTFEKLRSEIGVGGDVGSTHLVKGLDWKLLERVKKGENIDTGHANADAEVQDTTNVDDELDGALTKEVQALQKQERVKKGEMAPPPLPGADGQPLSRNDILQRLKASRAARAREDPTPSAEPSLGDRFKKVGSGDKSEKRRFTEIVNGRQREVLISTDKDGKTKRKVKWLDKGRADTSTLTKPEPARGPLGMEVPAEIAARQKSLLEQQKAAEDDDDDIFEGIGADYNPLGDMSDGSGNGESFEGEVEDTEARATRPESNAGASNLKPRSYFSTTATEEESAKSNPLTRDASFLAGLKRAAELSTSLQTNQPSGSGDGRLQASSDDQDGQKMSRQKELLEKLKRRDRQDADDMDLGFGESRFGDDEDEDGPTWEGEEGAKKGGRKRGPKKRKGDKDSINDVMGVLAGRQSGVAGKKS